MRPPPVAALSRAGSGSVSPEWGRKRKRRPGVGPEAEASALSGAGSGSVGPETGSGFRSGLAGRACNGVVTDRSGSEAGRACNGVVTARFGGRGDGSGVR